MANSNNLEQSVQSLPLQSYHDSKNFEDELKASSYRGGHLCLKKKTSP